MRKIAAFLFLVLLSIDNSLAYYSFQQKNNDNTPYTINKSEWVYIDSGGKLVYKATPNGNKIMDFSHAGYMGGGVALPIVPVKKTIKPSGGDDTEAIQSAIDEVSKLPLENGFRGTVLLSPGIFSCSGTLIFDVNGVVLRGSGSGAGGSIIRTTGDKHTAFVIGSRNKQNEGSNSESISFETTIEDSYVSSGSTKFQVSDASGFSIGDLINIKRPVTSAWIHFLEMDNLVRDGKPQTWLTESRSLNMERQIIAISGNTITIDVPLSDSYDAKYLNPPGTIITKISPSESVTQIGIEHLRIQCPPLEIAYGEAPYSAIHVNGDDCWVKDVYCEETMNTTVLRGNRITMQQVVVKHTYPNLGASKPTDFSIEGSQNLIDRCESTGGNTYFVWTSSLVPGPNVLLNCTFRGHGSRVQPHHRWSTGMLIDNCTVIDGGIDFPNRGVAGSGHGWTIAWGVVWNSIAKTYIIQNPPGTYNWAIGCIGMRMQTARYFDATPILPEGIFDSHGTPVTPQSLYLAQLEERLGHQANVNIGYDSNTENMFTNKSVEPSPKLKRDIDNFYGEDLGMFRSINTSDVRGNTREFGGEKAVDGNDETYWATDEGVTQATFELDTEGPLEINAIAIGEAVGMENRVQEYKIEGQVDSDWKLLTHGTTIGKLKVVKFPEIIVWKVRLTILKAENYPAIRKFSLYLKD